MLLAILYGIDWIFSAFYHFWVPLIGTVSTFLLPPYRVPSGGLLGVSESLHCHRQTSCFQLQSQEVWASFSSFMPRKGNSSRPLAMQREPGSSPDTWGHINPVPCRGISPWPCQPPLWPLPTAATFCSFPRIAFLGGVRHCAFKRLLYCSSVAVMCMLIALHCLPPQHRPPEPGHCVPGN